jgi:hypothetical protein
MATLSAFHGHLPFRLSEFSWRQQLMSPIL